MIRETETNVSPAASGIAPVLGSQAHLFELDPLKVLDQLENVQQEMNTLRGELEQLRRRDETLNLYMQRLDDEQRLAARLQQDFLPKTMPTLGPVRFNALFRPCGYVSGDLYDVMRLDERHVGFYMADAVGHGMPAALLTMFVKHSMQTKDISADGYRLLEPGEVLTRLNSSVVDQSLSHSNFVTALFGDIDPQTLEMRLAKAGHPAPLLLRADGSSEMLDMDGSLLGIFDKEKYTTRSVQLSRGDRLVVYTDGIEVAFADDRAVENPLWRQELVRRRTQPAAELIADLSQRLDEENGSLDPRDDLSVLIIDIEA